MNTQLGNPKPEMSRLWIVGHRLRRSLSLVALAALCMNPPQVARAASTCGVLVQMDVLAISTNVLKVGFPPFVQDEMNPFIYLQKSHAEEVVIRNRDDYGLGSRPDCATCHQDSYRTNWNYWKYENNIKSLLGCYGKITDDSIYRPSPGQRVTNNCMSELANCGSQWSNPNCTFTDPDLTEGPAPTVLSGFFFQRWTNYSVSTSPAPDGNVLAWHTNSAGKSIAITLSDQFTLDTLINGLQLAGSWPDWRDATSEGYAAHGGLGAYYAYSADYAELRASKSKVKYRIRFKGPEGQRGTIQWFEELLSLSGANLPAAPQKADVTFTGQWQYLTDIGGEQGKEVGPPPTNSVIHVYLGNSRAGSCDRKTCTIPGKGTVENGSVHVEIGLGSTGFGESAGSLYIRETSPSSGLATRQLLKVAPGHGVEVLTDAGGLRQVKAPQGLADIVTISSTNYEIRLYAAVNGKDQGFYVPVGTPFATWWVGSPGGDPNKLSLTKSGTSGPDGWDYEWSAGDSTWFLATRHVRKETRQNINMGSFRTNIYVIKDTNNVPVYQELNVYHVYGEPLGDLLVEQRIGGTSPLVSTWSYYDNAQQDGASFGKLKRITRPSGNWEDYYYTNYGRISAVVAQYMNRNNGQSNDNRVSLYSYAPIATNDSGLLRPDLPRRVVQYLEGHEISRTETIVTPREVVTIQRATPGGYGSSLDLFTTNSTYTISSFDGVIESVRRPDGTMEITERSTVHEDGWTTTVSVGAPQTDGKSIRDGTRTTTVIGANGQIASRQTIDILSGTPLEREVYGYADSFSPPSYITYLDGTSTSTSYDCCGVTATSDRDGTATSYTYDPLDRVLTTTTAGITSSNLYDAAGNVLATVRIGTDNSAITLQSAGYDLAGRQTSSTNALGYPTSYTQNPDGTVRTTIYPNTGTRIETYAQDGTLLGVTGTAVHPVGYTNYVECWGESCSSVSFEIKLDADGRDTTEWVKTSTDMLGRVVGITDSNGVSRSFIYNSKGQLAWQADPNNVWTFYTNNARGDLEYEVIYVGPTHGNCNTIWGTADPFGFCSTNRIKQTLSDAVNGKRRTRIFEWPVDNVDEKLSVSTTEVSPLTQETWVTEFGRASYTRVVTLGGGAREVIKRAPDYSTATSRYQDGRPLWVVRKDANGVQLSRQNFGYDAHGRQISVTDARTGTITNAYDSADQLVSVTVPATSAGAGPLTTQYHYDRMGQMTNTVAPDLGSVTNVYSLRGDLVLTTGDRTYPAGYGYDVQGRLTRMTNWSDFAGMSGARVTQWTYDPANGLLTSKTDAFDQQTVYYYNAARLMLRISSRAIQTWYSYNVYGGLANVYYDDGTPMLDFGYDRRGRLTTVMQNGVLVVTNTYTDAGELLKQAYPSNELAGLAVTNLYDTLGRQTVLGVPSAPTTLTTYSYDAASRLSEVTQGAISASYNYVANSPLVQDTVFRHSGVAQMGTSRSYDSLKRLTQIGSLAGSSSPFTYRYGYNAASQRTGLTNADNSRWEFRYDRLGQVTNGVRRWADGVKVAGQQFAYALDDIGNRRWTEAGGDAQGNNLRQANYTANLLNQYTDRTVPGVADILGSAPVKSVVAVNGETNVYRKVEYFQRALTNDNSSSALWLEVSTTAAGPSGTNTLTGHLFLPQTPEDFAYDADGNLASDGRWDYTWDAENRLLSMTAHSSAPSGSRQALHFTYDYQGRRISKVVSNWTGSAWMRVRYEKYLYDGWNLLAVLNGTNNTLIQCFVWGSDLSGTLRGAGGVGGLLVISEVSGGQISSSHFPAYDGNGNVMALLNASDATVSAQYEYGPFGELLRATGPIAEANPFRFSTKFQDDETDLLYYGYRYYGPSLGRWLSRDPIGNRGGRNLYAFTRNNSINRVDPHGLISWGAIAAALLEGAGIVIDAVKVPDMIDDAVIDSYGGPEGFMDATEQELLSKGGALPRDMFGKARAKDKDAINAAATGNEKGLYDRLQSELQASKLYQEKRTFIIKRLQEGTLYQGFMNVDFQDAGESSLGYAIGGGQLHYLYKFPPPTLELRLIDTYDFTKKGHMWGRLQDKGYLVTYDVNVLIETIPCPKAAPEKK